MDVGELDKLHTRQKHRYAAERPISRYTSALRIFITHWTTPVCWKVIHGFGMDKSSSSSRRASKGTRTLTRLT